MKKTLSDWASIAEILGAAAVVVSLVFVGLEVRASTQVARVASYERNIDSINEWRLALIRDPELVRLFGSFAETIGQDASDIEIERFRLNLVLNGLFGVYEKSYYAYQSGIMERAEWNRFESQACLNRERAIELGLWSNMEALFTAEFADYLASHCE